MNIKKLAASLLAAVMLTGSAAISVPASAVAVTDGILDEETGLLYVPLEDGTLKVTYQRYSAPTGDIVIPETFGESENAKTVTEMDGTIMTFCQSVTSVSIPKTVTTINNSNAWSDRCILESITVDTENPKFTAVDGVLFDKEMTELMIYPAKKADSTYSVPSTVEIIGRSSFFVSQIESVSISESVVEIGDSAFSGCKKLSELNIPSSVESIGKYCFRDCTALAEINIPSGVESIGHSCFENCTALTKINIPSSVESIGDSFISRSAISEITVDSENTNFCSVDNVLFSADKKTLIAFPPKYETEKYIIPDGTETILTNAFSGSESLKTVQIPESVSVMSAYAFSKCSIISVEIPSKVTEIRGTFMDCTDLETVTLPLSLTRIGAQTFERCDSLKTINFNGTKADWDMIEIDPYENLAMNNATIYFSDGTTMDGAGIVEEDDTSANQAPETITNKDGSQEFTPGVERKGAVSNADFETMKQIKATAPKGAFKEEVLMNVSHKTASLDGSTFAVDITFVDSDGNKVQPDKEITVKIPVPARLQNSETIFVYHINSEGKPEKVEANIETIDGVKYIVFEAKSFSTYELTDTEVGGGSGGSDSGSSGSSSTSGSSTSSKPTSSDTSSEPASSTPGYTESETSTPENSSSAPSAPSGDNANPSTGIALSVLPIALAVSAVIVIRKRK